MKYVLVFAIFLSYFLFGCTPSKNNVQSYDKEAKKNEVYSNFKVYEVEGEGEDYFEARRKAILDGVVKSIIDILGEQKFYANKEVLSRRIIEDRKLVLRIFEFSSTDIFNRGDKKVVKGIVKVDIRMLKSYLDEIKLSEKQSEIPSNETSVSKKTEVTITGSVGKESGGLDFYPREDSPIYNISFLVFVPNDKVSRLGEDEEYKLFLEAINSKLSSYGLDYVDFYRVVSLSKKFQMIYEEKSGEVMPLSQMLAQDLKANVYIEADINFDYNLVSGNNVDITVSGSIKAYDSSTGKGLGSLIFSRNKKSNRGIYVAKTEAISEIVDLELPRLLKILDEYFSKGIKIEVVVMNFKDISEEKEFMAIIDSLPGIEGKKRKNISGNVSTYEIIYKSGSSQFVDDLIDAVSGHSKYSRISIDQAINKVIIKLR
ncbi:MAG: hypothetical protein ACK4F9_06295 [Brevinematia bacterium]